ncbi:MAG TPA: xanthine dehydrogenase family protein subunit M [Blastocatellia bacterium]|nr:xanthine dehydrogenase family protein subunit M [Blastocatellia bacterium]
MIPASFDYHRPTSIEETLSLLSKFGDDAKILSGGHSLVPAMKLRLAQPGVIIDIGKVPGMSEIRQDGDAIVIGALVTHYQVESSDLVKRLCPLLAQTAEQIGDVQVRNRGTIGGSLAHSDPAADYPAAMLALGAEITAVGPKGKRTIKADDFFVDMLTTALEPNEILTEIRVPATGSNKVAYLKVPQSASGFAIVGVAVNLTTNGNSDCKSARIGITGLSARAFRANGVESGLAGKALDAPTIKSASSKAADGQDPLSDIHASGDYRAHLARVYTQRAIEQALS